MSDDAPPVANVTKTNLAVNLNSSSVAMTPSVSSRSCLFFANGTCRNGDQCHFSHDLNPNSLQQSSPTNGQISRSGSSHNLSRSGSYSNFNSSPTFNINPSAMPQGIMPAPIIINVPPGQPVYSIDVECVATGK